MCPHCGKSLPHSLSDGIAFCYSCNRLVETTLYQKLLSAAYFVRKYHCYDPERLEWEQKLSEDEADLVISFIGEQCFSPQEFSKELKKMGVEGC